MKGNTRTLLATSILALASCASAQVASICPSTNVCYKLNIPESTASSGSGDIFFQISAPSSYEWVALGQGKGMTGANMFVVYTSSGGSNVTLSPRTANGHNMPTFNANANVELLEGSGVSSGIMTANVKCSSCSSWSGGSMDFKASSGNWIYAYKSSGGPKNTNDKSANINEHNGNAPFTWSFASAKGGSSVNPLINAAPSASGSAAATPTNCIPRPASATPAASTAANPTQTSDDSNTDDNRHGYTGYTGYPWTARPTARPTGRPPNDNADASRRVVKRENLPYCDELPSGNDNNNSNSNSNSNNAGFSPINSGGDQRMMLIAHGVLAALAFVILFPAGAIAIRLASFPGIVWLHAAFQVFAYLVYIAAFGLGVYLATEMDLLDNHHPIIGIVVFVLIFLQPIFGFLHHLMFKKHNSRTLWSYVHIWLGRSAITLGIINGGLGLQLADSMNMSSKGGIIAYGVIAGLVWLVWVAAIVIGERRRKRAGANAPPKYTEPRSSPRTGSGSDGAESAPINGHYAPKEGRA